MHIKLKPRTTVPLTNMVHSSLLEAAYLVHKSQHSTKIATVRADYTWMKVTCQRDAVKIVYKLAEGVVVSRKLYGTRLLLLLQEHNWM
jgi:hypothetical protein